MKKFYFFFLFLFILIFGNVFSSFAITSYSELSFGTFADGPFMDQRAAFVVPDVDGGISAMYPVPDWREGSSAGDAYYKITFSSYEYLDSYIYSKQSQLNNICIAADDPLIELYIVDKNGNKIADVLDDAFITNYDNMYFYGVSVQNGIGVAFRSSSTIYFTEFSQAFNGGSYHDAVANAMPYMAGVYDGNSTGIRYPGIDYYSTIATTSLTYGYDYFYFPVVGVPGSGANQVTAWKFHSNAGVLNEDSKYTFNFEVHNITNGRIFIGDPNTYTGATVSGTSYTASINGQDTSLANLGFGFRRSSNSSPLGICFIYKSSNSDDIGTIPPDTGGDSGGGNIDYSSALGGIDKNVSKLASNLAAGLNNLSSQLGSQTSQIVTAFNTKISGLQTALGTSISSLGTSLGTKLDTVSTNISLSVSTIGYNITQSLSSVQTGITDKLGTVQSGITTKLGNVQTGINNKLQSVKEGLDTTLDTVKTGITDKLQTVQEGINTKLGSVQTAINNKLQNVQNGINTKLQNVSDAITGGYDNTNMSSENSELSGAVDDLEQAEKEVIEDVTGYITDFEYPSVTALPSGAIAALAFFSSFLQSMFVSMGDFSMVITFSLTMIFVLIIVGYHRIRA